MDSFQEDINQGFFRGMVLSISLHLAAGAFLFALAGQGRGSIVPPAGGMMTVELVGSAGGSGRTGAGNDIAVAGKTVLYSVDKGKVSQLPNTTDLTMVGTIEEPVKRKLTLIKPSEKSNETDSFPVALPVALTPSDVPSDIADVADVALADVALTPLKLTLFEPILEGVPSEVPPAEIDAETAKGGFGFGPSPASVPDPGAAPSPEGRPAGMIMPGDGTGALLPPGFSPAVALSLPRPRYPEPARRRGEEGMVLLSVRVGPEGRPERVELVSSSGSVLLDKAAREALLSAVFVPAREGERPVPCSRRVSYTFHLEDPGE